MLQYVYDRSEVIAPFVASMIPACRERGFGKCSTIGVVEGGMLIAGIVYHNWNPEAGVIEISAAAVPGHYWLTRETLRQMYEYPFITCGCQMVMNIVAADNEAHLFVLARFGYSLIRIPRLLGRDKDSVVCLLTIEDWRANKFNKRLRQHAEPELSEAA